LPGFNAAARLVVVLAAVAASAEPTAEQIGQVRVYLSAEEALLRAWPGATRFDTRLLAVTDTLRARLYERGIRSFAGDSVAVYIARDSTDTPLGYAAMGEEIGKYRPITFLVAVDLQLRVSSVAILVYRESRGGEVRRQRFLRQYRGKQVGDPIRINRDIINITGATLSVRALNAGVRKALFLLQAAFDETQPNQHTPSHPR
jgi:hypothetical protein